jgi:hypothetical protein
MKRYSGRLSKPSAPGRPVATLRDGEPTPEQMEEFETRRIAHQLQGLGLLLKHYKIPEKGNLTLRLMMLAIELGEAHVPFFLPAPKNKAKGKPGPRVDAAGYLSLYLALTRAKRPGDRGDMPALRRLLLTPAYRHYARAAGGEETLRKRLQRARRDPVTRVLLDLQTRIAPEGWELFFDREESARTSQ